MLISAIFMGLLLSVLRPFFETNDDISLQNFVNLSRGVQDAYSNSANYVFGLILSVLYRITQQLPWYTLFLYATMFVSFSIITHVILSAFQDGFMAALLIAVIQLTYGYQGYISINYTKVAACAGAAGALLIFFSMRGDKVRKFGVLLGSLAVFAGFIVRPMEGLAAAVCVSPAGIYLLLSLKDDAKAGMRWKRFMRYIICLIPALILVAGAAGADHYALNSNPARQEYDAYDKERTAIMDYGFPKFRPNKEAFENLGINRNAYNLYTHWDTYDPEKLSMETMAEIADLRPEFHFSWQTILDFFSKYPEKAFSNPMFLLYLFVLCICILYGKRGWKSVLTVVYQLLLMTGLYIYMFYKRRYGVPRVEVGLWLAAILGLLPILENGRARISKRAVALAVVLVLAINQKTYNEAYRRITTSERERQINFRNYTSQLSGDRDHLYLFQVTRFFPDLAYAPFDRVPVDSLYNLAPLGGWTTKSIPYLAVLERYGVKNPYRDMIGNDKVRLVTDDPATITNYLHDYYDPDCKVELVGSIGKNNIYQVYD